MREAILFLLREPINMENKIEYIEEDDYLIRNFHGIFHIDEIVESWKYLIENKLQEKEYTGVLNNFCDADLKMQLDDLEQLLGLFKKHIHTFKNLKLAVVMTTPENIIFPYFAKTTSQFKIEAFTTVEAAKNWLQAK